MTQPPSGPASPRHRPRPGAPAGPAGSTPPRYVDYGTPRAYDTSMRPASGLTAARYAPAAVHRPEVAQPASAWSTQTRRVQEVAGSRTLVPVGTVVAWIAVVVFALALVLVLGLLFLQFAVSGTSNPVWWPGTAMLAFVSLLVIVGIIVLADRWDPQPIRLLLIAVLWGAAIAVGISYVVNNSVGQATFSVTGDPGLANFASIVISAPLTEEITKGLGLVVLLLLARRYFNGPLDGLIYGALIGGGFAFTENILYYSRVLLDGGNALNVLVLFVIRGVLNIFGHAIYVSLTGIVMGYVARKWGTLPGVLVFLVAVIPGILLHFSWNFLSSLGSGFVLLLMLSTQALLSLLWLGLIGVLVWDESRLTRVRLGDYANLGWLTHEEVDMLATWKGRREGRRWAAQMQAKPLMRRFIRESADLASVRQRLLADGANPKAVAQEAALLGRLSENRRALLGPAR